MRRERTKASRMLYVLEKELEMQKDNKGAEGRSAAGKGKGDVKANVGKELDIRSLPFPM